MKNLTEPVEEKEFIVEVEIKGTWTERYNVFATSEKEAKALWSEKGEYIESMDYMHDESEISDVYEY